jgi:hypothetical protein
MTDHEFDPIVDRLLSESAKLEPVDLDRIKLQVLGRGTSYTFNSNGARRKALAPIMAVGFMTAGSAGVLAGGGSHKSNKPPAACNQYKTNGKAKSCKPKTCKTHKNGNQTPNNCTPKSQKPPKTQKSNKPPKTQKSNKPPKSH